MRSDNSADYQTLSQAIGVMSKGFMDGYTVPLHSHERDQLLYAIKGIMRVRTEYEAWVVPSNVAVLIPAGIKHSVTMHGAVDMRTLYIDPTTIQDYQQTLCVLTVSNLLRKLILELSNEAIEYEKESRAGSIARLIEHEISRAKDLPLHVKLPKDDRLQKVCLALLNDPSDSRTLDAWAEIAGASTRTLARLFESDLDLSFNKWRQRVRFQNALEALSTGCRISEISRQCGYRSPSAFSSAFHKVMNMPPSSVRLNGLGE